MSKKKAIKIATASAIALTGAVAVAQPQADAATNSVDKAITKATTQVNKAFNLYYNTAKKSNKLPSGSAIRKEVKLAEQYYAAAQKEIAAKGGSKKASYTKKLEASKTSLNRAKNYVAAVSVTLKAARTDLDKAIASGKQGTVASKHAALEKKIAEFEAAVKKVFGPDARRLLTKAYTTPAKAEAAAVENEVAVYAAYKEIESKKLITTDLEKAGQLIESVKDEVAALEKKNTTLAKNLLKAVEKNNKAYEAALPAVVTAVSATNASTLTLTGTNLNNLKAEDIAVAGNTVSAVTAAADGKSATVTLSSQLVVDTTTKVTVKGASFDVTYKVEVSSVSVEEATYDDDTKDQFVSIKVNGNKVTTQELISAGYDIEFEAYENKNGTNALNIFDNTTTGELVEDLNTVLTIPAAGEEVYVKVKLTKGSEVLTSGLTEIKVKNINLAADSITAAELLNNTTGFEQNSTTLVTGETAKFSEITVKSASDEDDITSGFTVKSSNESVISVNKNTNELTAQGPGTATITVTYGGATYTKTFTVKNDEREATKVEVDKTSVTVVEGGTKTVKAKLLDQYGDPMTITNGTVDLVQPNTDKVTAVFDSYTTDETGEAVIEFTGVDTGSSIITFRDAAGVKIGTTSVKVTVTDNGTLSKYELTADTSISDGDVTKVNQVVTATKQQISTDTKIDVKDDKFLKVDLKAFNSTGVELAKPTTNSYTVEQPNVSKAGVINAVYAGDGYLVVEAGTEAGTATITVRNNNNRNIVATFRVTVEKVGYDVTGVTFKNAPTPTYAQTLNYEDFLSYTKSANDPIISGIKLSKSVAQPVRLDLGNGDLYVDKNADGDFNNDDFKVGSVELTTTGEIADTTFDALNGVDVATGDDGTVLFKVLDSEGKVVATKAVSVDF